MADPDMNDVEPSDSATKELVSYLRLEVST
jgi:hypothetical protein